MSFINLELELCIVQVFSEALDRISAEGGDDSGGGGCKRVAGTQAGGVREFMCASSHALPSSNAVTCGPQHPLLSFSFVLFLGAIDM